ncbi:transcriptional activator MYB-like protein [Trifolium pratense]|uniref:Transcriptional activator MYB-like protein n=1 Tax=Trifolium pratense TaxID=57577 RepID=A0A2K3MQ95_TRIPR|nr:transcriptional activator MYB-like protein [Trifolium pratense]
MSSLNLNNDGHGFSFDLNVLPLSQVPSSSSTPLLGHVGNNMSENTEIAFNILKPLVTNSHEKLVTNTEGNKGYFGDEEKNMSLKVDEEENDGTNVSLETKKIGNDKFFIRGHWTPVEDDKLIKLVKDFGPYNWNNIAKHFHGRSGKSCRLRWRNQLDPKINRRCFSEEEEVKLLAAQNFFGNKWTIICNLFHGRTDNAVKNHFNIMMARRKREKSSDFSRKRKPTFVASESITSTIDVSNSACTTLRLFGLPGERKEEAGDFGYDMGKPKSVNQFNYSYSNSEALAKSVATIRNNVLGESENVRGTIKVSFIDFLGVGDT